MQKARHQNILHRSSFFVTGTDTEVGKTFVSGALACAAEQRGLEWHYFKPAESGARGADADSGRVAAWTQRPARVSVGYQLDTPLAPWFASEEDQQPLSVQRLDDLIGQHRDCQPLIVEGAGGILTPYTPVTTALDLAVRWQLPTVIVVANRLGCLNHTLLTIHALTHAGIEIAGVIFNDTGFPAGLSHSRNPADFLRLSATPLLAWLPYLGEGGAPSAQWWEEGVARANDLMQ